MQIIYLFQMLKIILYKEISDKKITMDNDKNSAIQITGTCFIQKIYAPSSSLLQGKHLPFTPSPLRLNIFRLFVILSLTQLYRYTPKIFLFSTTTFKYKYRAPLRRIGQKYSAKVAFSIFSVTETDTVTSGLRWIFHMHSEFSRPSMCSNAIMIISPEM